jgi:endonuclease YncB( thermonuclease family)
LSLALILTCGATLGGCDRGKLKFAQVLPDDDITVHGVQTVRVADQLYVLAGIDTPRPAPEAGCWAEALLARETRFALDRMVQNPHRVYAHEERTGADGHVFARVEVNGSDLSEALLDAGLAAPGQDAPFDWCGAVDPTKPNAPELGYPAAISAPAPSPEEAPQTVSGDQHVDGQNN